MSLVSVPSRATDPVGALGHEGIAPLGSEPKACCGLTAGPVTTAHGEIDVGIPGGIGLVGQAMQLAMAAKQIGEQSEVIDRTRLPGTRSATSILIRSARNLTPSPSAVRRRSQCSVRTRRPADQLPSCGECSKRFLSIMPIAVASEPRPYAMSFCLRSAKRSFLSV